MPLVEVPDAMRERCVGVFVGGCIEEGEHVAMGCRAHAHNRTGDPFFGWICFMGIRRVWIGGARVFDDPNAVKRPSRTFWHEYAHLLAPNSKHGSRWREAMRRLGQPIEAQYKKRR